MKRNYCSYEHSFPLPGHADLCSTCINHVAKCDPGKYPQISITCLEVDDEHYDPLYPSLQVERISEEFKGCSVIYQDELYIEYCIMYEYRLRSEDFNFQTPMPGDHMFCNGCHFAGDISAGHPSCECDDQDLRLVIKVSLRDMNKDFTPQYGVHYYATCSMWLSDDLPAVELRLQKMWLKSKRKGGS